MEIDNSTSSSDSDSSSSYIPECEHNENCYKNCYYCECTCEQCIKDFLNSLENETYNRDNNNMYIITDVETGY